MVVMVAKLSGCNRPSIIGNDGTVHLLGYPQEIGVNGHRGENDLLSEALDLVRSEPETEIGLLGGFQESLGPSTLE